MTLSELTQLRHPLSDVRLSAFEKILKDHDFLKVSDARTKNALRLLRQAIPSYDKWSKSDHFYFIGLVSAIRRALIKSGVTE